MDMSDPSSINSSDLDTMGNILASSNENNCQASETDQSISTTQNEPGLPSENVEVTECQNEKILDIPADDATEHLSTQDIDLIIMGKSSGSVTEQDAIPETSNTVDNLNISESDDNVEDLWLAGDARELVKVETDEDFDVIVKSLETAIVETERYDIGADKVSIMSPILVPESIVASDCCDPVISSDSLLDDFTKELVSPPSLSEMAAHGEQIMLSDNVEMADEITKELEVEASKLQTDVVSDTDDQCFESLIDTSIIASEFATITDDIQETFDEQSSSLFEAADAVTELTDNIDSRPSLLELQEAHMTCDIAEQINKDVLPLIKDTLLNDDSLDSTEEILNNIVNKTIESESRIEEVIDKEVDEVLLDFPETDCTDENITEMLNKSIDMEDQQLVKQSLEIKPGEEQEIEEKHVEEINEIITETSDENVKEKDIELIDTLTEENVEKSEENVDELTKTDKSDSESEEVLTKEVQIMDEHEAKSDINIVPEVNIENLTDGDIFEKTEAPVTITGNESNDQLETTQEDVILTEPDVNSTENNTEEEIMKDLETDMEHTINTVPLKLTESQTILQTESVVQVDPTLDTESEQVQVEISENSIEQIRVEVVEENQDELSVTSDDVRLDNVPVVLEDCTDKVPVVLEESVDDSSVSLDENKSSVTVEESVDNSRVVPEENKLSLMVEESVDNSSVNLDENKSSVTVEESVDNSRVIPEENKLSLTMEESVDNPHVILEENKLSLTVEDNLILSPATPDKCSIISEEIVTVSNISDVTSVKTITDEQITESLVDEPKSSATTDKPKDIENSNHTSSSSSSESQSALREDQVKLALETVEHSPPKKIKLIREKLYIPPVNISTVLPSVVDTLTNVTGTVISSEDVTEPINTENMKIFTAETVKQINDEVSDVPKEQQVIEKTSPVRTRKLKLKRDYEPEQVVTRLESELIKSEDSVTKDIKQTSSLTSEQENINPTISETISDDVTSHCESQNVVPVVEQPKTDIEQEENKMISETELTVDKAIVPDKDTAADKELEEKLTIDKVLDDTEMSTEPTSEQKSAEPVLVEVNIQSAADTKLVEVDEGPTDDSISNEIPVTCAVDVPTTLDNDVPDTEDTPSVCSTSDAEKSAKSPEPLPDLKETTAEIISTCPEQVNSEESPLAIPETTSEVLPDTITEERVASPEKKSEESTSTAPETISLRVETKLSILEQMLMKDVVVTVKEHARSSSVLEQPSYMFTNDVETIKECESKRDRGENELLQAASDVERADESTIEDELMQAAKAVETRVESSGENDDELKQAAQEATEATMEAHEEEFSENSAGICEDEIIAVTQALEMERAQENLVEISKTEAVGEISTKGKPVMLDNECSITKVTDNQSSLESADREEMISKQTPVIQQVDKQLVKAEDNKLKRHIVDVPTTPAVAAKKSKSNKDADINIGGRKIKCSPVTEDSVNIGATDSVTIEPVTTQTGVENVGKLRISRRKLEEPTLSKSVTITKPLRVEVDDLGNSSMSPSYFSDLAPQRGDSENIPKIVIKPIPKPEERSSPKITIKPIVKPSDMVLSPKMSKSKSAEDTCTPRITIKPIIKPDPLKITITKQKTDDTHSILKIYKPDDGGAMAFEDKNIPKLTIKPIGKTDDMQQHSPRITIKPVKPPSQHSPSPSISPKITVKPVVPPSEQSRIEISHSPKITVKSVVNPEDSYPKVTIKPILRPDDSPRGPMSPRQIKLKTMTFESSSGVTVEPIAPSLQNTDTQLSPMKISVKPFAKMEETLSPKLTIKPITKTCEIVQSEDGSANPLKLTIKPILKPEESYQSPKITIKPIMKPEKADAGGDEMDKPPERIILKIQKTNLPSPKERAAHAKESRKEPEMKIEAILQDSDRNQKLDKIKLKLTKEGSHAQIIPSVPSMLSEQFSLKRPLLFSDTCIAEKRSKGEFSGTELLHNSDISINLVEPNAKPNPKTISEEVTIVKLDRSSSGGATPLAEHISQSKFKEMLLKIQQKADITCTPHIEPEGNSSSSDDVKIVGVGILSSNPLMKDPLSIHDESSSQDVVIVNEIINTNPFHNVQIINAHTITDPCAAQQQMMPKKRGRPRKNPLEVKPEIKGEDCVEIVRPKRTCRAPPGRTPFAVKERKPRGAGRGRGGGRGRGAARSPAKSPKEPKTPRGKALKEAKALAKLEAAKLAQEVVIDEITIEDSTNDTTPIATPVPPVEDTPKKLVDEQQQHQEMVETEVKLAQQVSEELLKEPQQLPPPPLAVYEEETRMSADNNNSRAQTPARQVIAAPQLEGPEESQSSVQSTATTESNKNKKGRLEVCDPDSAVTGVEQIVEYSWGAGGTYMLQEQIAQFLGVKSFKRKYPGLTRRPVEMQERDYIREKGLVSESMCDMGLTAVPSSEILDIMYTDFQEKYEEYRKYMRDKQSKEISNKQKAISLATSQEKNKIDFKERAIRSAANWNVNFNKTRKESRRCCMDLQTFTINFPLGRTQCKMPQKSPVGQYPIALVPGQFTDYYKRYTSNELHYLPLNTVRYGPVLPNQHCTDAGQSDGSQSDTDSSSGSDSDSSDDSMSTVEDTPTATGFGKPPAMNLTLSTPKAKVH